MDNFAALGRWLVIGGVALAIVGGLIWLAGRFFNGSQLPGTIRIESGGLTCVFPLLASIVLSIVLTIVLNVIARLMK